ncbi:unnamed protein product [Spirodela intermedia]|uniref:Exostosin GT47 domain-containing protein n=1 Tax=Spirodela intermedia TaxID=51605 RepID=A0A7I8J8F6_SPIIN|nr:unnamed protein product [Spirodela intermedia]CAA6666025.1 unnamed protein product [Spirodela intermedia]
MSAVQKHLVLRQKICPTRTRLLLCVAILTTILVLGFHSLTVSPGNGSMTLFTAIGKTILPSHSPNGSPSPSYDSGSAAFPLHDDRKLRESTERLWLPPTGGGNANATSVESYDLMESLLKVYIYKEGEKPIFHQPELTGIYSSEGWFMRHMEGSRRFLVEEPRQAHLFYMPFSSHLLKTQLYVPDSHSHDNLIEFLQKYVSTIAAKYPFWNRTDGADHFLVSCHDWATHETWRAMGTPVRALCNADTTEDFVVGKDVSLPETNVRSVQDPAGTSAGGRGGIGPCWPSSRVRCTATSAPRCCSTGGRPRHGDPRHDALGGSTGGGGVKKAADYAQYMKSSRFCVCPRGFEVNSPRVVEAIFYECVPVIISDNFVPPFFEVLDWGAFSVIVEEKDVPRLKEILLSISRPRYLPCRPA